MRTPSAASPLLVFTAVAAVWSGCSTQTAKPGTPAERVAHATYALTPGCGNGVLEPERGETCDDANVTSGDGCSSTCLVEAGFVCVGERPTVCTAPDQSDAPASYGFAQHGRALPPVSPFVGRDFWTDFPTNIDPPSSLAFKIAGAAGTTGTVTNTAGSSVATFTIPAGGVSTVTVPVATYHVTTNNTVLSQALHIVANAEVRVLATNESMYTTDTWALWSTEKLGTSYIILDAASSSFGWEINLIAPQAGTTAVITDAAGTTLATVSLGAGQNYQYATSSSIAGFAVTSNQPIAVLAGTMCTNDVGAACDMTVEQIAPVSYWARDYAIAPTYNTTNGRANHKVVASQNNTTVIVTRSDGTQNTYTLNARQSTFIATNDSTQSGYFIASDKPIGVASNVGAPGSVWDPSLVTWPPLDGYVSDAKMPTSGNAVSFTNFLSVITRTSATNEITVNGAAVSGWTAISTTGYSFAQVAVPAGDNTVHGNNGVTFGAVAVGGAQAVSYAYSSPYDIATVGGSTNCFLGTTPPDYEAAFAGSSTCDQDDTAATDDEDALIWPTSAQFSAPSVTLAVPCNDNYFGIDVTATVHGWVDFNQNGTFETSEHASAGCVDNSPNTNGSASLVFSSPPWNTLGTTTARLRICDSSADCSSPAGSVASGEVEDHLVHLGTCGDGFFDTFEACDDGNTSASDGCSATCTVEPGFACSGNPSVCLLNQAPSITSPADNALLTTATPTLSGTCVNGATVRAKEGANVLCTATCASTAWSCVTSTLSEGSHSLTADQVIAGQTSVPSAARTLRIDTQPPVAPVISSPVSGTSTNVNRPVISGTCEPGATVNLTGFCSATCAVAGTFTCTASLQTDGVKTLVATQVDVGGNTSPASASVTLTIDTAAPATPTITSPTSGVDPGTAYPVFTGACETGATVRIVENLSTTLCTTTCSASAYTCSSTALGVGSHTVQARQTDVAGNQSPFSAQLTFPITQLPNQPPTIVAPTAGALLTTSTPTISLTCTTGNPVTVYEDVTVICSGTCASSAYSCTPSLAEGSHTITATQTSGGTESSHSAARTFSIDSVPPAAPSLTTPSAGSAVFTVTPVVGGTCETGASMTVLEGATTLCTSTCASGAFSCTSSTLALGSHTVLARQTDVAGNVSPDSSTLTFGVALCGNGAIEYGEGCDDANATPGDGCSALCMVEPGFTCGAAGAACTAQCGDGIQTPGEACDDGNTTPGDGCSATCAVESGFLCASTSAPNLVTNGGFDLGNTGFISTLTYLAAGPNSLENQYGISIGNDWRPDLCVGVPDAERSAANASLYFNAGTDPSQVIYETTVNVTAGANYVIEVRGMSWTWAAPPRLYITMGSTQLTGDFQAVVCSPDTPWTRVSATYRATATGSVTLRVYDRETASVGNDGALDGFSVREALPSTCGRPTLTAPAVINAANAAAYPVSGGCFTSAGDVTVAVAGTTASTPCVAGAFSTTLDVHGLADGASVTVTASQVNAGGSATATATTSKDTQVTAPGWISPTAGAFLPTGTPTLQGTCESGATVTISEGLSSLCTAACVGSGFSCTSAALSDGAHTITATQVDAAGNPSAASGTRSFTVDTLAPVPVVIDTPTPGLRTNVVTPTVSGQCETGATITVSEGATSRCTATCAAGLFSCQSSALAEGARTLSVTQMDSAGNSSTASSVTFTVDVTAPASPVITSPVGSAHVSSATPTVTGTCETDAAVVISEGGTPWCTATCTGGAFTCSAASIADGLHVITARQTDVAGNQSSPSLDRTFTVDTQVSPPSITTPSAGAFLSTLTPALAGGCEEGATVSVSEGGTTLCVATCASSAWTCTSAAVAEGAHTFSVSQVDLASNQSQPTTVAFVLDVSLPAAPSISTPSDGAFLRAQHAEVSGTCETSATVAVLEGAALLCSATCSSGAFSCDTGTLPEGLHTLTAHQTDRAGNLGATSTVVTVTFDVSAPAAPGWLAPTAGAFLPTGTPTLQGTCESGATVTVSEGLSSLCTAACVGSGFSCTSAALTDGAHTITAAQVDAAGNSSAASGTLSFTVDTLPPVPVVIDTPTPGLRTNVVTPAVSGQCETGTTVTVSEGATSRCSATCLTGLFSCQSSTLAEGARTLSVTQMDSAGNTSTASSVTFTVDVTAPASPAITSPVESAHVSSATPTVTGTCETDAAVVISEGGTPWCTATCTGGAFTCSAASIADGLHVITARQTDVAGNQSSPSLDRTFTVDTQVSPPSITTPSAGAFLSTLTPALAGACEDGATVSVSEGGTTLCVATCASSAWTCTSASVAEGAHTFSVSQVDLASNQSQPTTVAFVLDVSPPAAPSITAPGDGAFLRAQHADVSGSCESSATVEVLEGATLLCSATCTSSAFSCDTGTLPEGPHALTAHQTDRAGNLGATSTVVTVTFDVSAPAAPTIAQPSAGVAVVTSTPAVSGGCEAYADVEVKEAGSTRCSATCTVDGTYQCVSATLSDGTHTFDVEQTDRSGNLSGSTSVTFTVDTTAPAQPVLIAPARGALLNAQPLFSGTAEPESSVVVRVDGLEACRATAASDGSWSCSPSRPVTEGPHLVQLIGVDPHGNTASITDGSSFTLDSVAPGAPSILIPATGQVVSNWPTFSGRAEPGAAVRVEVDGTLACSARADAMGAWACVASTSLASGAHQAQARATDAAANASTASATVTFTTSTTAVPGAPVVTSPTDGSLVSSHTPTIAGRAEPGSNVVLKVGGAVVCTETAGSEGAFTCTSAVSLPDGAHVLVGTAANSNGVSPASLPVHFTVDTVVPVAPSLTVPTAGATVNAWPAFRGTAESGATVTVTVDGATACTAVADATGHFACLSSGALATGAHQALARAVDAAGNESDGSSTIDFTVDPSAPPSPPVVTSPAPGQPLGGSDVTFSGEAEPGSEVTVIVDGQPVCHAIASASGDWTCTATGLPDGTHTVTTTTTNGFGTSETLPSNSVTTDTQAPAAPSITSPASGATVNALPLIEGTAEARASVHVLVDGLELCQVTASSEGAFRCTPPQRLLEGSHAVSARAVDLAGLASPTSATVTFIVSVASPSIVTPAPNALLATGTPEVRGTAEPGTTVTVRFDDARACQAVTGSDGQWACTASAQADGAHSVEATADDGYGTVKKTNTVSITIDTTTPTSPSVASPADGTQNMLGGTVTFSGTGEPKARVDVLMDGAVVCSALVGDDGHWTCQATAVPGGTHTTSARQTDPAGNTSTASSASSFTNVTNLPSPTITEPTAGSTLTVAEVTFAGTATPGTSATVTDDTGAVVCSAVADSHGDWSCTGSVAAGQHTFTAQLAWEGLTSPASSPISVTLLENGHFAGGLGCTVGQTGSLAWLFGALLLVRPGRRRRSE